MTHSRLCGSLHYCIVVTIIFSGKAAAGIYAKIIKRRLFHKVPVNHPSLPPCPSRDASIPPLLRTSTSRSACRSRVCFAACWEAMTAVNHGKRELRAGGGSEHFNVFAKAQGSSHSCAENLNIPVQVRLSPQLKMFT